MVLIDTSTRWSHMCLLSTQNYAFAKIMTEVISLKANFLEHQIQSISLDNAVEFSLRAFNDYCTTQEIQVQHSVPYVHTQNDLDEYLIKRIKLIVRHLLHNCNLPISCWVHAIVHTADLIQLRPTAYHSTSQLYLVRGNAPNISHPWKFRCAVYALILPQKRTSMGPIEKWVSMWDIIPRRLLSTWSHFLMIYLQFDTLIVNLMRTICRP
jgi:hypothetical protein